MPGYRFFLVSGDKIAATSIIYAASDKEAAVLAYAVAEACEDTRTKFELWRMGRLIATNSRDAEPSGIPIGAITERMQASLLATEELLCESRSRIARSRKLLMRRAELREVQALRAPKDVA